MTVPLVELPPLAALGANVALWAAFQAGAGYVAHRRSLADLERDRRLLRLRPFEVGGRWYERVLRIGRWKDRAPEAGATFAGGLSKRRLPGRRDGGLERFELEARRAELAHWWSLLAIPLTVVWNPPLGIVVMVAYGLAVNLPLIAIQRYNRARIQRVLARRAARHHPAAATPR